MSDEVEEKVRRAYVLIMTTAAPACSSLFGSAARVAESTFFFYDSMSLLTNVTETLHALVQ